MDPRQNFPLRKGTLLSCISYRNSIENPEYNLYFTTPAEAIFSLFRDNRPPHNASSLASLFESDFELSFGQTTDTMVKNNINDLYLNTFYLTQDIVLNPLRDSSLEKVLTNGPTLERVKNAIDEDCSASPDKNGYVIPYTTTIFYGGANQGGSQILRGRITTYSICKLNIMLHTQSFRLRKTNIMFMVGSLLFRWKRENPNASISGGVILDLIDRHIRRDKEEFLEAIDLQPEIPGLASSPIVISPSLLSERIEETPLQASLFNPQNPETFQPRVLSRGGEMALDAFADVPSDILRVMALGMTLDAVAKTCGTSQRFNREICTNEIFWTLRLEKDYGKANPKTMERKPEGWTWKRYYTEISGNVEPDRALEFANNYADQPDVLNELRVLANNPQAYQNAVNDLRVDAGFGPINFPPRENYDVVQPIRIPQIPEAPFDLRNEFDMFRRVSHMLRREIEDDREFRFQVYGDVVDAARDAGQTIFDYLQDIFDHFRQYPNNFNPATVDSIQQTVTGDVYENFEYERAHPGNILREPHLRRRTLGVAPGNTEAETLSGYAKLLRTLAQRIGSNDPLLHQTRVGVYGAIIEDASAANQEPRAYLQNVIIPGINNLVRRELRLPVRTTLPITRDFEVYLGGRPNAEPAQISNNDRELFSAYKYIIDLLAGREGRRNRQNAIDGLYRKLYSRRGEMTPRERFENEIARLRRFGEFAETLNEENVAILRNEIVEAETRETFKHIHNAIRALLNPDHLHREDGVFKAWKYLRAVAGGDDNVLNYFDFEADRIRRGNYASGVRNWNPDSLGFLRSELENYQAHGLDQPVINRRSTRRERLTSATGSIRNLSGNP
jgi:hypothetical protein